MSYLYKRLAQGGRVAVLQGVFEVIVRDGQAVEHLLQVPRNARQGKNGVQQAQFDWALSGTAWVRGACDWRKSRAIITYKIIIAAFLRTKMSRAAMTDGKKKSALHNKISEKPALADTKSEQESGQDRYSLPAHTFSPPTAHTRLSRQIQADGTLSPVIPPQSHTRFPRQLPAPTAPPPSKRIFTHHGDPVGVHINRVHLLADAAQGRLHTQL